MSDLRTYSVQLQGEIVTREVEARSPKDAARKIFKGHAGVVRVPGATMSTTFFYRFHGFDPVEQVTATEFYAEHFKIRDRLALGVEG